MQKGNIIKTIVYEEKNKQVNLKKNQIIFSRNKNYYP